MESKSNTREIKYRVWNDRYKEFTYWGFIDNIFKGPPTGSGLSIEECKNLSQQFTGLKDSKVVDIFEGDRLQDPSGEVWVVYWYADHACFGWYNEKNEHIRAEIIDNLNTTVIGHIYQTTNL